jgi:hypothetical protein
MLMINNSENIHSIFQKLAARSFRHSMQKKASVKYSVVQHGHFGSVYLQKVVKKLNWKLGK